jgi:hypothetical protein
MFKEPLAFKAREDSVQKDWIPSYHGRGRLIKSGMTFMEGVY